MWNRSYRWQRIARLAAGGAALVLFALGAILVAETSAARRAASGAGDLAREMNAGSQRTIEVVVPESLGTREGTLVYLDRDDGIGQVVGRVVAVEPVEPVDGKQCRLAIRMMASSARLAGGGVLKGAPASLDLRDALRLLVSPDAPDKEVMLARDRIWPSVQAHVLPDMIDRLVAEVSAKLTNLDEQDRALLAESVGQLRRELEPLEAELIDRVATRSWETLGVKGLAEGIMRTTGGSVQNQAQTVEEYLKQLAGRQAATAPVERSFLSKESSEAIRIAIEVEILSFWQEHNKAILAAFGRVVADRREEFEAAFRDRWAGVLYERAVVPAWADGQDEVLAAVQGYANDFTARRLLTKEGGPRLLFAYALRSSLDISDRPLLVYRPDKNRGAGEVAFESYLP